jgi:SAM-dependent methyltransferase
MTTGTNTPRDRHPKPAMASAVTRSMGVPHAALPIVAELFADVRALGTPPSRVARWLREHGIGKADLVADLGCGKGAAGIATAAACGCRVLGVDAFPAFVESARAAARRRGVATLCEFRVGNAFDPATMRRPLGWPGGPRRSSSAAFDAAIMLNVAALEGTLPVLRRAVRRGGVYVVDDAVAWDAAARLRARGRKTTRGTRGLRPVALEDAGIPDLSDARMLIERLGDTILREHRFRLDELRRLHATIDRKIRARAAALMRREPKWREVVAECLQRHREAAEMLRGDVRPVMWLVRRG